MAYYYTAILRDQGHCQSALIAELTDNELLRMLSMIGVLECGDSHPLNRVGI